MVNEQTKQKIINESQKEKKYVLLQVNLKDRGRKKKRLQMTEKSERENVILRRLRRVSFNSII